MENKISKIASWLLVAVLIITATNQIWDLYTKWKLSKATKVISDNTGISGGATPNPFIQSNSSVNTSKTEVNKIPVETSSNLVRRYIL